MNELEILGIATTVLFLVLCSICVVQDWLRKKRIEKNGKFKQKGEFKK